MNKEQYNFHTLKVLYLHITLEAKCPSVWVVVAMCLIVILVLFSLQPRS